MIETPATNRIKIMQILGYNILVPENRSDISVVKKGWCTVDVIVPRRTITINTDCLPKGQCSADYFITVFNNQLNAILK